MARPARQTLNTVAGVVVLVGAMTASVAPPARAVSPARHVRLSRAGRQLWLRRYNGRGNGADQASAIAVSPDGSTVFVTGGSVGTHQDSEYATIAYDAATGAKRWVASYDGPGDGDGDGDDAATALGVSPDGTRLFVTGSSAGSTGQAAFATIAYDASTGAQLWVSGYTRSDVDVAAALGVSPDGTAVFVTGRSGNAPVFSYATVAYAASTGKQLWASTYTNEPGDDNQARAIGVSPDGSAVFVTGESSGANGYDYTTVAYSASTGTQAWVRRYSHGDEVGDDIPYGLAVSPDGSNVFVTGSSDAGGGIDFATVAYRASDGAPVWATRYRGLRGGSGDAAYAIAISPDGFQVYAGGISAGHMTTVAYSGSTGTRLWVRRILGSATVNALAVSPDGSEVVAAGRVIGESGWMDYLTAAYDSATGSVLWNERYDGPGDHQDVATSVAWNPIGQAVYVTGYSDPGANSLYDYATIAYGSS